MLATFAQTSLTAHEARAPKTLAVQPSWIGVSASLEPTELGYATGLALISRFVQLMATEGLVVDARRMRSDHAYAFEQLALAHTSTLESLRLSAMQLFSLYAD